MNDERQRVTILTKKDLTITWYSGGPGAGGQYRNKHNNCCRIIHEESGAKSQCTEERSQQQNLRIAFDRLIKTPQMKFWIAKRVAEIRGEETVEQKVARETTPDNFKFEIKRDGKWVEAGEKHFESEEATAEWSDGLQLPVYK